ncbi:LuxR C-terminal-related transcriptional regulator [Actinomadura sp. SCN-SB]|uniref:LuxR C-terminal-related transcriptional regulator n=1 Tax=Actinomadura sp. SCN-SB TaxID=3373092 RepID=UPI0037511E3E
MWLLGGHGAEDVHAGGAACRHGGVDGLTAIERIAAHRDPPVIVALTTFDADHYVIRALRAGAAGFLLKSTPPDDLVDLVRVAADGHTVMSAAATRRLVATVTGQQTARDRSRALLDDLTERETDVLACLGEGLTNAQIGERLCLSEATVKGYVSRLLDKLQCANRTQAGLLAVSLWGSDPPHPRRGQRPPPGDDR